MNTQTPLHLIAEDMDTIEPIGYSITFETAEHKQYWTINLTGNRQAFLTDDSSKPVNFSSKEEAVKYCKEHWPDLRLI